MYHYVSATLRKRGKNQVWQSVDIAQLTLLQLFDRYADGYVTLTNPALGVGQYHVDLNALKHTAVPYAGGLAFENWIQSTNMPILPAIPEPTFTTDRILYSNAAQAQYTINRILPFDYDPGTAEPLEICHDDLDAQGQSLNYRAMTNLEITRNGINYDDFHRYILVSVNGFYHRSTITATGLQIIDGAKSGDICGMNNVGLVSFRPVGAITQLAITDAMISKQSPANPFSEEMYINLGIDITGKSVMASLGGYLHVEDPCVTVVGLNPGIVKLRFSNIDLAERYFESLETIDTRSWGLTTSKIRSRAVVVDELYSDDVLRKLVKCPQSFIIVVDAPLLFAETMPINAPEIIGLYDVPEEPRYPLRAPSGRGIEYWRHFSIGAGWRIRTPPNITPKRLYTTTAWRVKRVINSDTIPGERTLTPARLVAIGTMRRNG